ncbi:MAG: hypothetical protein WCG06_04165 [Candidatus Omnitrophota bacterium]
MKKIRMMLFVLTLCSFGMGLTAVTPAAASTETKVAKTSQQKKTATPKKRHHKKNAGDEKPAVTSTAQGS